LTLLNKSK